MSYSVLEIEENLEVLSKKIGAPKKLLPPINDLIEGISIELDELNNLYYVTSERGDTERNLMADLDDLLYHVFQNITLEMAIEYELENRKRSQDCRRILFQRQEELLGLINENWKQKKQKDHDSILKYAPFNDFK